VPPIEIECDGGSLYVGTCADGRLRLTAHVPGADSLCLLLSPGVVQELLAALIAKRRESTGYPWS
jgi:hypothetical protein